MESLYHQTNKLLHEVQGDLGKMERCPADSVHIIENEVQAKIDHVISNSERLTMLVNKEPPTRRANAKLRVDQLKYDCQHLQAALRQLQHKRWDTILTHCYNMRRCFMYIFSKLGIIVLKWSVK